MRNFQSELTKGAPIVWLSVAETAFRLSISTSQVRRNEAAMHRLGAIAWKDSPNHRRHGELTMAGKTSLADALPKRPPGRYPRSGAASYSGADADAVKNAPDTE